jgi:hypothetical protein
VVARSANRNAASAANVHHQGNTPQSDEMINAIGMNPSNRIWVNVMTFLRQLIENATHLNKLQRTTQLAINDCT